MLVPDYWYNPLAADAARDGRYGNQHVRATHSPSRLYQVSYECNKIQCHSPVCARLVSLYRLSVFVICHFNNIINYTVSRIDNEFLKKSKIILSKHLLPIFLHSPPPPTPTRHFCFISAQNSHASRPLPRLTSRTKKTLLFYYIRIKSLPKSTQLTQFTSRHSGN